MAGKRAGRKRKKGGGRKKIPNMPRTASGRISEAQEVANERRQETEREAMETVVRARMRHTGLSEELARKDFAGSVLGLLHFDRRISDWEYEVGKRYAALMASYYALTGIPFPSARAQDIFRVGGFDGDESLSRSEKARAASNRVMIAEKALLNCSQGRMVKTKTFEVCVLDIPEARDWTIHTLSFVHKGLDLLREPLGVDRRAKDAA